MIDSLWNMMFFCAHRRTTFPLTPTRNSSLGGSRTGTYVVCLDCGKEFPYSWKELKIERPAETAQPHSRPVPLPIASRPERQRAAVRSVAWRPL